LQRLCLVELLPELREKAAHEKDISIAAHLSGGGRLFLSFTRWSIKIEVLPKKDSYLLNTEPNVLLDKNEKFG